MDHGVSSIVFSPNGKYIAAGLRNGKIQLSDAATGASYSILEGHSRLVTKMTFLHDGSLASVSRDGTLRLWEPVTGVNLSVRNINSPRSEYPLLVDDDRRLSAAPSLSVLPMGDLAVLWLDGRLRIWSREKNSLSDSILPDFWTRRLHGCLPQGTLVIESIREGEISAELLLFDTNARKFEIMELDFRYETVAVSPDNVIALSLNDGRIKLYHVVARSLSELGVHSSRVRTLVFSPDGSSLVSIGSDQTIRSWDLKKQAQSLIGSVNKRQEATAVFSPDGKQIVTSGYVLPHMQIWNASFRASESLMESPPANIDMAELSPCGQYVATSAYDEEKTLRIHNTMDASEFVLMAGRDKVLNMVFSPDGKRLASASEDGTIRLWDTSTGVDIVISRSELDVVTVLEFSPDGKHLASGNKKGEVRIWSAVTGHLQSTFKHQGEHIGGITFSVDGKRIVVVSRKSLDVWDTGTRQSIYHTDHVKNYTSVAVSHDQKNFAYRSTGRDVIIYNSETKEQRSISPSKCSALAFSNDDKLLACCKDTNIELWSMETLQCTEIVHTHRGIDQLSFTADGTCLKTNAGLFQLVQPEVEGVPKSRSAWRCHREWMMEGTRKMLWLPPDWRIYLGMKHQNGVFVCNRHRGFTYLQFTQGGPVPGIE